LKDAGTKILAEQQKMEKASANLVVLNKFEETQEKMNLSIRGAATK
jgi:hypothetical protein